MSSVSPSANAVMAPVPAQSSRRAARVLRGSLRLFGSVDLFATMAVVMPISWIQAVHALCGLGEFPEGPLPLYLARSTSMLYAFHGAILWFLSTDVPRYQPVIRFIGAGTIVFGAGLVFVDRVAGIPPWWYCLEGPVFAITGVWLMAWSSRLSSAEADG